MNGERDRDVAEGFLRGAGGGLAGALTGPWSVMLAHRMSADADSFLKGPHGPPFFDVTLFTAVYYGCLGLAVARGPLSQRAKAAGLALCAALATLAVILGTATRVLSWGENSAEPTMSGIYVILAAYLLANVLAVVALAWGTLGSCSWSGLWPPLAALVAAYPVDRALQRGIEHLQANGGSRVSLWLPSPPELASGMLWGAFLGAGLFFARRRLRA